MDSVSFLSSVRRRLLGELRSLSAAVAYPSPVWSLAFEALTRTASAPSSERRARLCHIGAEVASGGCAEGALVDFAVGLELHHLFVLVLDDEMDHAQRRRAQPTLHRVLREVATWEDAERLALLCAGVADTRGLALMTTADPGGAALRRVLAARQSAALAQFHDVVGLAGLAGASADARVAPETFERFLFDKGGDHSIAAPLVAGARLAGADDTTVAALERWAFHVGVAHQALDDVRDFVASPLETGKDAYQDLVNRRPSLLTWLLAEAMGAEETDALLREPATPAHRRKVIQIVEQHRVVPHARALIERHLGAAERACMFADPARAGLRAQVAELGARAATAGVEVRSEPVLA